MHLVGFVIRIELNVNKLMDTFIYMHTKRKILAVLREILIKWKLCNPLLGRDSLFLKL